MARLAAAGTGLFNSRNPQMQTRNIEIRRKHNLHGYHRFSNSCLCSITAADPDESLQKEKCPQETASERDRRHAHSLLKLGPVYMRSSHIEIENSLINITFFCDD